MNYRCPDLIEYIKVIKNIVIENHPIDCDDELNILLDKLFKQYNIKQLAKDIMYLSELYPNINQIQYEIIIKKFKELLNTVNYTQYKIGLNEDLYNEINQLIPKDFQYLKQQRELFKQRRK